MCPCAKSLQSCLTLRPRGLQPARLLCPWDFSGKNTGVGCHFLLWRWRGGGCLPSSCVSCIAGELFTG